MTCQPRCRFPTEQVISMGGVSHIFLQCIEVVPDMTEESVAKIIETATRDAAAAQ